MIKFEDIKVGDKIKWAGEGIVIEKDDADDTLRIDSNIGWVSISDIVEHTPVPTLELLACILDEKSRRAQDLVSAKLASSHSLGESEAYADAARLLRNPFNRS